MKRRLARLMGAPALLVVAICCGLPLLWIGAVILTYPSSLADLWLSSFRLKLLASTLLYNLLVALVACTLGLPAGLVMGRHSGWFGKLFWVVAPGSLLLPFLAFNQGWIMAFRIAEPAWKNLGLNFLPGGIGDTIRCVWTLGSWLWGLPALIIGMALRRLDPDLQLAAWLDGALWRTTFRALLGSLLLAAGATLVMASQEFLVYEPTGVRVVATEVRMVFATGAFSSVSGAGAGLEERSAAALLTAAPLLVTTLAAGLLAFKLGRRFIVGQTVRFNEWPPVLNTPTGVTGSAAALLLLSTGVPFVALAFSLQRLDAPAVLWSEFGAALGGSGFLFLVVALIALLVMLSASVYWAPGLLILSVLSFLIGGEILAIALLRIFNSAGLAWVYDGWPLPVISYLGRFAFIALLVARSCWSPAWQEIRAQAQHDGATALDVTRRLIWPLAWPLFVVTALLMGVLSLGEIDATATLTPQSPPILTTRLLSMANSSRSNLLAEGALLSFFPVGIALLLLLLGRATEFRRQRGLT